MTCLEKLFFKCTLVLTIKIIFPQVDFHPVVFSQPKVRNFSLIANLVILEGNLQSPPECFTMAS